MAARHSWPFVLAGLVLGPPPAGSDLVPLGPDFQAAAGDSDFAPDVAVAADGDIAVAWQLILLPGFAEIHAGIYDGETGLPQVPAYPVNNLAAGTEQVPVLAMDGNGGYAIVWESQLSDPSDSDGFSIQARLYDAAGDSSAGQFRLNDHTTGDQRNPAVAMDPAGHFVVAWESDSSPADDASLGSIQARRFDASGVALAPQFQVNTSTLSDQREPAVARDALGGFVVVWTSTNGLGADTDTAVLGQRYTVEGTPQGGEFLVNSYTDSTQGRPSVSSHPDGRFVVAWESLGSAGDDADGYSIQAQRFGSDGMPDGDEIQVNTFTAGDQRDPDVSTSADGGFVVVWQSEGSGGTDDDDFSIQVRQFDARGLPATPQSQVNTFTSDRQAVPVIAQNAGGEAMIAWSDLIGNPIAVRARRYLVPEPAAPAATSAVMAALWLLRLGRGRPDGCRVVGSDAKLDQLGHEPSARDLDPGHCDREREAARTRAPGVEEEHPLADLGAGTVRVAAHHGREARRGGIEIELGEVVQQVEGQRSDLGHLGRRERVGPRAPVDVPAHRGDGCERTQRLQHLAPADVARVEDVRAAAQRVERLRPHEAVRVRDDADRRARHAREGIVRKRAAGGAP